jgi:CxxC motif-containing protein (DUF1111 family)
LNQSGEAIFYSARKEVAMVSLGGLDRIDALRSKTMGRILLLVVAVLLSISPVLAKKPIGGFIATDPGVRGGPAGAGVAISGLNSNETAFFEAGFDAFNEVEGVGNGLGPRFNLDSCVGCHAYPDPGGTSPLVNPQVAVAIKAGAQNVVPFFITPDGPVREARFKFKPDGTSDGGVHDLFTITGRSDANGCIIAQPDFVTAANNNNLIFRIPTPVFGAGLIENIPDNVILANMVSQQSAKAAMGISGHPNRHGPGRVTTSGSPNISGNDGSITRFGWKAQNKSLLIFTGEAYNVEMGVTNELFPQERDETPGCVSNSLPEDATNLVDPSGGTVVPGDVEKFTFFMRTLAPPVPAYDPSMGNGLALFTQIGCALCHTPALTTAPKTSILALQGQQVNLFSDLLLHRMGKGLADGITQGSAGPDEFRTAPLWGLGQRIFFVHDGRTKDLLEAIGQHDSPQSEARAVIKNFNGLTEQQKQDILNFLRSL